MDDITSDVQNEILDDLRAIRDQARQIAELERQLGGKYLDAVGKHTTEEAVGLRARVAELETERDRLLGVIRQIEWCNGVWVLERDEYVSLCPLCDQIEGRGHSPDCQIGAALATSGPKEPK